MRILAAIIRQTLRASIRSKVVVTLLALNLLAVVVLPLTVAGDGTAIAELQVSLTYSLRAVTALISLAAMWVGCSGLSREIEAYNLHLVLTKPAPRWLVWSGKWLGTLLISGTVFALSSTAIFLLILYRFDADRFPAAEIEQAKSEVLVGRRRVTAARPNFDALASAEYQRRLQAGQLAPEHDPRVVLGELQRQIKARHTEVLPESGKFWPFEGLRAKTPEQPVFVRYRLFVGSKSASNQRDTVGRWLILNPDAANENERIVATPLMKVMSGAFQEFSFPAGMLSPRGVVGLVYENFDPEASPIVFQPDDGPDLLIRAATFAENWFRGLLVGLLRLALLSALGCTFGAMFSTPVAIFVAFAYLLLGAILNPELGLPARDAAGSISQWKPVDLLSFGAVRLVDLLVVSFRQFDITFALARGHLIDGGRVARLVVGQALLRGIPLVALGIWVFTRRELGRVIRR